jgi:hypothetical protein
VKEGADVIEGMPDFDSIPETKHLSRQIDAIQNEIRNAEKKFLFLKQKKLFNIFSKEPITTADDLQNYANVYKQFKAKVKIWMRRYGVNYHFCFFYSLDVRKHDNCT